MAAVKHVAVNERGRRIGESHPRAKLTDHEVDLIRELHEGEKGPDGKVTRLGYKRIAAKFEISKRAVRDIISCRRRAQIPARLKRLK